MIKILSKEACNGCSACASACPTNCITMKRDDEGFLYPSVLESECISCSLCERVCERAATPSRDNSADAFALASRKDDVRSASSSGGAFSVLAEFVLSRGGAVFGAALSSDMKVRHVCVERMEDIPLLRGSKYVQSEIGDSYKRAKEILSEGREVLFSGTPCQVGGLFSFLGRDYDNLLCADIVCHGAPSPLSWEKYLEMREEKARATAVGASFRDKSAGWRDFSMRVDFSDGKSYVGSHRDDEYMKAFLSNLSLRPSCYNCRFKGVSRAADITLADFWGVDKTLPEAYDEKGVSLVLVHSEKARRILDAVSDEVILHKAQIEGSLKYNRAATESVACPKRRDAFMKKLTSLPFDRALKAVTDPVPIRKAKSLAKKIKRRFLKK